MDLSAKAAKIRKGPKRKSKLHNYYTTGDRFLLAIVSFLYARPFRPGIAAGTFFGRLRHHLQLCHTLTALSDCAAGAVIAGVAAANDQNMQSLGIDSGVIGKARI